MGIKNGISITAFGVRAALDANRGHCALKGDLRNGYNEGERAGVIDGIREEETLHGTLAFKHALLAPEAYIGMGNGTALVTAPFRCCEGTQQGAVESGWDFSLLCNKAFQRLNNRLKADGGGATAIIDDNYLVGPP